MGNLDSVLSILLGTPELLSGEKKVVCDSSSSWEETSLLSRLLFVAEQTIFRTEQKHYQLAD